MRFADRGKPFEPRRPPGMTSSTTRLLQFGSIRLGFALHPLSTPATLPPRRRLRDMAPSPKACHEGGGACGPSPRWGWLQVRSTRGIPGYLRVRRRVLSVRKARANRAVDPPETARRNEGDTSDLTVCAPLDQGRADAYPFSLTSSTGRRTNWDWSGDPEPVDAKPRTLRSTNLLDVTS